MTEENDKLKRLLNTIQIPEPDEEARKGALKAAVAEFEQLKKAEEEKVKGFSWLRRLTDKTLRRGPVMSKKFVIAVGTVFSIILVVIIMMLKDDYKQAPPVLSSPMVAQKRPPLDILASGSTGGDQRCIYWKSEKTATIRE